MGKSKEPIRLRKRLMATGITSLYLDIYINGKRSYEYLKLYLIPEKNKEDKDKNKETLLLAETIRGKRLVELHNGEFGLKSDYAEETNFWDFYSAMVEKRKEEETRGNWGNWISARNHIKIYDKDIERRTFKEIDLQWLEGFRTYLTKNACSLYTDGNGITRVKDERLAKNSQVAYLNKVKACINHAYDKRIIHYNPAQDIKPIKGEEGTRMYLTIDELRLLSNTPCQRDGVRRAFLFSCLTGIRWSDIHRITWSEVVQQGNFTRIIFKQKKTKGQEYLDITPQAAELMGDRGKATELVFYDLICPNIANHCIREWALRAGIQKYLSFHCARHTFATMMLDLGTDIYTVSKLLGHRELSTTQIYAKVLDKNKQSAIAAIPNIIGQEEKRE